MVHVFRYAMVVCCTLVFGPVACLLGLLGLGSGVMWAGRQWERAILFFCGIRVEASGLEHIDPEGPQIFMSNHQSVSDIAAIMLTCGVDIRFVAKRELTWIPLFGWALALGGNVIVDRRNHGQAIDSLRRAAERIRSGVNVIVFPEGTRSQTGSIGPFKSGGFHLALQSGVPIVPITVSGSHHVTPKGSLKIHSGLIRVRYGQPIPTDHYSLAERDQLKARVRAGIEAGFDPELQPRPDRPDCGPSQTSAA